MTYVEIYNNSVFDLLENQPTDSRAKWVNCLSFMYCCIWWIVLFPSLLLSYVCWIMCCWIYIYKKKQLRNNMTLLQSNANSSVFSPKQTKLNIYYILANPCHALLGHCAHQQHVECQLVPSKSPGYLEANFTGQERCLSLVCLFWISTCLFPPIERGRGFWNTVYLSSRFYISNSL